MSHKHNMLIGCLKITALQQSQHFLCAIICAVLYLLSDKSPYDIKSVYPPLYIEKLKAQQPKKHNKLSIISWMTKCTKSQSTEVNSSLSQSNNYIYTLSTTRNRNVEKNILKSFSSVSQLKNGLFPDF